MLSHVEIKETKENQVQVKDNRIIINELLKETKDTEAGIRCRLLLRANREHDGSYPFEEELKALAKNYLLSKKFLLDALPELQKSEAWIPDTLSLLDAICLMVGRNLTKFAFAMRSISLLANDLKLDSADTFLMLLKLPDFPRSIDGGRLLEQLNPAIQSRLTDILDAIIQYGLSTTLAFFLDSSVRKNLITSEIAEKYRSGDKTIFHKLFDINDYADGDNRIAMLRILASKWSPTPFEKIKRLQGGEVDALNAQDQKGNTPLDYAALWAERKHVDVITALGVTSCDDWTCLYRFQAGKLSRALNKPVSPDLFPSRDKDMRDALLQIKTLNEVGNFSTSMIGEMKEGQKISIKRLYSNSDPVTNAALRIAALGNLASDSIVRVLRLASDDKNHLLIGTEYMNGGSLARCFKAPAISPLAKVLQADDNAGFIKRLEVSMQAAMALSHIHTKGKIIHGDVHPGHILLREDLKSGAITCKFSGLDLSPSIHDTQPSHIRLELWSLWTAEQNAWPPELIASSTSNHVNNYSQLSDVYSLGAVLRWMFYFDLKNDQKKIKILEHFIKAAMEPEPRSRATAEQLCAMLSMILKVENPNDPTPSDETLYTVIDSKGNRFELNKENWAQLYNEFSLPGATLISGKMTIKKEEKPEPKMEPMSLFEFANTYKSPQTWTQVPILLNRIKSIFYNVPPQTFPLFGREWHRNKIRKEQLSSLPMVLLGQAGMGKTTLAADFCHNNRNKYQAIIWLDASGSNHLVTPVYNALKKLAPNMAKDCLSKVQAWTSDRQACLSKNEPFDKPHPVIEAFRQLLKDNKPSLVVIDDTMVKDIQSFIPKTFDNDVHYLLTSASTSTTYDWKGYAQVEVKSLDQILGARFFDGIHGVNALVLSSVLGYSPLLLTIAAAYSHHCRQTSDSFLTSLQLQMRASNSRDYATSCVDFLIQQVPLLDKSQTATDLLAFISLLNPTNIPARWFHTFLARLRKADEAAVKSAVNLLLSLKLISLEGHEDQFDLHTSFFSMHPTVALHTVRDQIIRKDASRIMKVALSVIEDFWTQTISDRQKESKESKTSVNHSVRDDEYSMLPHIAAMADQAVAPSIYGFKEFIDGVTMVAEKLGDYNMTAYLRGKLNSAAPVGTAHATLYETPRRLPNRLKIPDYSCKIWETAARFNGAYTQRSIGSQDFKERPQIITAPVASTNINPAPLEPNLDKYLRNLRSHYAPLPVRNEQWAVFDKMIREFLAGYFLVTNSTSERHSEAARRQSEFETEMKQSKQHTAFHLTTHAHSHLIRILAKLANFFTAHFRLDPNFEKGILQLMDLADAFGQSGNKLFDAFTKHEYGEREIIFCFRRYDGEMHTNNYRQHPPGSYVHVKGVFLTRDEMEMAMNDEDLRNSARQTQMQSQTRQLLGNQEQKGTEKTGTYADFGPTQSNAATISSSSAVVNTTATHAQSASISATPVVTSSTASLFAQTASSSAATETIRRRSNAAVEEKPNASASGNIVIVVDNMEQNKQPAQQEQQQLSKRR